MKTCKRAVLPPGFQAAGMACGIKKSGRPDLALFFSRSPAHAACMFTSNVLPAAPILVCRKHLKSGCGCRAIVANSGNANCFTGKPGLKDAERVAEYASGLLGIRKESVL